MVALVVLVQDACTKYSRAEVSGLYDAPYPVGMAVLLVRVFVQVLGVVGGGVVVVVSGITNKSTVMVSLSAPPGGVPTVVLFTAEEKSTYRASREKCGCECA